MNDNTWQLVYIFGPILLGAILAGVGWMIRHLVTYKDGLLQNALAEGEAARAENEKIAAELKATEKELTEVEVKKMFADQKIEALERELGRVGKGGAS